MEHIIEEIEEAISSARIKTEKAEWDKMRIACTIFVAGFIVFSSIYIGYWYMTDWKDIQNDNYKISLINQSFIEGNYCNDSFCPIYYLGNTSYTPICL